MVTSGTMRFTDRLLRSYIKDEGLRPCRSGDEFRKLHQRKVVDMVGWKFGMLNLTGLAVRTHVRVKYTIQPGLVQG
jgi:hypothetical protein